MKKKYFGALYLVIVVLVVFSFQILFIFRIQFKEPPKITDWMQGYGTILSVIIASFALYYAKKAFELEKSIKSLEIMPFFLPYPNNTNLSSSNNSYSPVAIKNAGDYATIEKVYDHVSKNNIENIPLFCYKEMILLTFPLLHESLINMYISNGEGQVVENILKNAHITITFKDKFNNRYTQDVKSNTTATFFSELPKLI